MDKGSRGNVKIKQRKSSTSEKRHCFNCGLSDHLGKDCPTKENGPKCFKCGERGYIAAKCVGRKAEIKDSYVMTQITQTKCSKEVTINNHKIVALIDTGSDLCLMRADLYSEIGSPSLERKETRFCGVGLIENVAFGEFHTEMSVDGHSYNVLIRVVSNHLINHRFLVGTDFFNTVELYIKSGNISINPIPEIISNNNELPEIFQVDLQCEKTDKIDLMHIPSIKHRSTIENIVNNYHPTKTRETNVKMTIILKDEEPVCQRARRLSPLEKEKVNNHISE